MKNTYYIFILTLLLGLTSCNEEFSKSNINEGRLTNIGFHVEISGMNVLSRAMGNEHNIRSLQFLVFDKDGVFVESKLVENLTPTAGGYKGNVKLTMTGNRRIIHIVANYPEIIMVSANTETRIIPSLSVNGNIDAYWQRIELENGIDENTQLSSITLLRNFACINIENNAADFQLISFRIVNVPESGSVAPFSTVDGSFPGFGTASTTYEEIINRGYRGYVPVSSSLTSIDAVNNTVYVYETPFYGNGNDSYILVNGKYKGVSGWYKLGIAKDGGPGELLTYYNILRNFKYTIHLQSVTCKGCTTAQEAAEGTPSNYIKGLVEVKSMLNFFNGKEKMEVDFTKKMLVNHNTVRVRFRYWPDFKTKPDELSGNVQLKTTAEEKIFKLSSLLVESDDEGYFVDITPSPVQEPAAEETYEQTLYLVGDKIDREIYFRYRHPYQFEDLRCSEDVPPLFNSSVVIEWNISADIPKFMFPLFFHIKSDNKSIYPDADKNKINLEISDNKYDYVKKLTYAEYKTLPLVDGDRRHIRTYFLTNCNDSSTKIYVDNEYFEGNKIVELHTADHIDGVLIKNNNNNVLINNSPLIETIPVKLKFDGKEYDAQLKASGFVENIKIPIGGYNDLEENVTIIYKGLDNATESITMSLYDIYMGYAIRIWHKLRGRVYFNFHKDYRKKSGSLTGKNGRKDGLKFKFAQKEDDDKFMFYMGEDSDDYPDEIDYHDKLFNILISAEIQNERGKYESIEFYDKVIDRSYNKLDSYKNNLIDYAGYKGSNGNLAFILPDSDDGYRMDCLVKLRFKGYYRSDKKKRKREFRYVSSITLEEFKSIFESGEVLEFQSLKE